MQAKISTLRAFQHDAVAGGISSVKLGLSVSNVTLDFVHLFGELDPGTQMDLEIPPDYFARGCYTHTLLGGADDVEGF
jgi:hypothetical protein